MMEILDGLLIIISFMMRFRRVGIQSKPKHYSVDIQDGDASIPLIDDNQFGGNGWKFNRRLVL